MTNFLQTPGADPNPARNRNRDAGPLDAPAPQSAVPPVKMVRTSSKPRNKNHFDKSLTAHLGRSPKSPAMPPAPQVWQHPTASPRFDGLMPTPDLSAPTNSPASVFNGATATSGLQFSFSDLYNLGLVEGGTLDCQPSTSLPEPATTKAEPTAWLEPGDYRTTNPLGNFLSPPAAGSPVFSSPASTWSSSPDLFLDPAGGDHFSQIPMQMTSSGSSSSSNYVPASVGTNQAPQLVEYFDHMLQGNLSTPKRPERMIAEPPPFVPSSPTKHTDGAAPTYDFLNHDPAPALNRSPRKLNKKRSRQDFEDPDSISTDFHTDCDTHGSPSASDGESDFDAVDVAWSVPPSPTKGGHGQQQTYTSRRLRPGPKPKRAISQPEPYYQTLSGPPPAEILAQALSTMPGEDQYHNTTDDEGLIGSLPKSVVRNLYEVQKAPEGEQGRRFNCLVPGCDRVFPRKSAVESHIQTHLEDKPFVCPSPEW